MLGAFILAISSIASTLFPFPGVPTSARGAVHAGFPRLDRLSITKRIIEAHSRLKPAKTALRLRMLSQTLHYRSIRMLKCAVFCYASDINNLGQVSLNLTVTPPQAPEIVDADGSFHSLSGLLSNDRPYRGAEATAINDFGGVAGNYAANSGTFLGNLAWQLQDGVYKGLYFDGRQYAAEALAINDYDITVGDSSEYPYGYTDPQPEIFSQFIARHVLLGLNEPQCESNTVGSATGINDANTIVGYEFTCEGQQAVRFSPYGYAKTFLPPNLSPSSSATAVNQLDDITGTCASGPFLYQAASNHTTLLPPRPEWDNDGYFYALGLNASDQVIGDYEEAQEPYYYTGWLYTGGKTYDLNAILPRNSGWVINTAIAINDAGQIVGQGDYTDPMTGVLYGNAQFVMTP